MISKKIIALSVLFGVLSFFNTSKAIIQIIEPSPVIQSNNGAAAWLNIGDGYYVLNDPNNQYFTGVSGSAKSSCFPLLYNYDGMPFTLDKYKKSGEELSRMDLTFDKKIKIGNIPDIKISKVHLLVGGNIGNVYLKTKNYVYSTDISMVFKYQDGSEVKKTAPIEWNWSSGTNLKGANYERVYVGQNPCYKQGALYIINFINPYPDKAIESFEIDDDFTADYPYTDIMAVTADTNKVIKNSDEWDMGIKFDSAYEGMFYPFSEIPGQEGEFYFKKFDGTDDLYEEYTGREACGGGYWGDVYEKEGARRAKGWYAERKKISDDEYRILIRGVASADCNYGGPGYAKGELSLNVDSGWAIDKVSKCSAQSSNKGQETYCSVWAKKIEFAAGSNCGGCCACADSGSLDIEVIVKNNGISGEWPGEPLIVQSTPEPTPDASIDISTSVAPLPSEKPIDHEIKKPMSGFDELLKGVFSGSNIPLSFFALSVLIFVIFIIVQGTKL